MYDTMRLFVAACLLGILCPLLASEGNGSRVGFQKKDGRAELVLTNGLTLPFRKVPEGIYDVVNDDGKVVRTWHLDYELWFMQTELSNLQYSIIMGLGIEAERAQYPFDQVSRDSMEGLMSRIRAFPIGSSYQIRLPTEAEWECMAVASRLPEGQDVHKYAWIYKEGPRRIGGLLPGPHDFHDVYGNVEELVLDDFAGYFNNLSDDAILRPNVFCVDSGANMKVLKGGDWTSYRFMCNPARRNGQILEELSPTTGMRLVLTVESPVAIRVK